MNLFSENRVYVGILIDRLKKNCILGFMTVSMLPNKIKTIELYIIKSILQCVFSNLLISSFPFKCLAMLKHLLVYIRNKFSFFSNVSQYSLCWNTFLKFYTCAKQVEEHIHKITHHEQADDITWIQG